MDNRKFIEDLFKNILFLKARNVQLGFGSFITMGFGNDISYEIILRRVKEVKQRPEWYLWVYMCFWELKQKDEIILDSEDDREIINEEIKIIEGKKLIDAKVISENYDMLLEFEDGISLHLISNLEEDDNEQWKLFSPDGKVLIAGPFQEMSYNSSSST